MSKMKKRALIFAAIAIIICIPLYFISSYFVITSPEVQKIYDDLMSIDTIYHKNTEKSFSPEVVESIENMLASIDTLELGRVAFLEGKALRFKAIDLYNRGKFDEAFTIYKNVEALLDTIPFNLSVLPEQAHISNLLGLYHENILKNYGIAESYHQKQFNIYEKYGVTKGMIIVQTNLGTLYKNTQQFDKAEKAFNRVDSLWKTESIEATDSTNYIGSYYGQSKFFRDLGIGWAREGNMDMAQKQFDRSLAMSRITQLALNKLAPSKAAEYQAKNNSGIGLTYYCQKNNTELADSILYYFQKAKAYFDQFPNESKQSIIDHFGKIALGHSLANNCELAQRNLDQGMKLLTGKKTWSDKNYPSILSSQINTFATLSYQQAKVWEICGRSSNDIQLLEKSLQQYIYVLSFLDKIRIDYTSQIAIEANGVIFSDYAGEAIDLALTLEELTKDKNYLSIAFELSERIKSFLLRNAATFEFAQLNYQGEKKILWEKEQNFKTKIIDLEAKNVIDQNYEDSLILVRRAYLDFINELKNANPNSQQYSYYLDRFNDDIPSINYIQNSILKNNEALIEYQWIRNKIIAFVISKNKINTVQITISQNLQQNIFKYSESLKEITPHFEQTSTKLYQTIFEPLLPYLDNITDLIIIRDKGLNQMVFQNLLTEKNNPTNDDWKENPYLMNKYNIVYTYSLASKVALDKLQLNKPRPPYQLGVFAAYPDENANSNDWACGGKTALPLMKNQMSSFTSSFLDSTDYLFKEKATSSFFENNGKKCSVIHFILHGCFSKEDHPLTNFLQFTPSEEEDGKLTVADIYNLQLDNQLAVLSSCKTADGQQRGNEGLQSIARAFSYSGCPTVIAALDNLEDQPTSILFNYFYKNLFAGQPIHVALKNAKMSYLENATQQEAHPKYWANIICIGSTDPLF